MPAALRNVGFQGMNGPSLEVIQGRLMTRLLRCKAGTRLSLLHQYRIERETPGRADKQKQSAADNCEVLIELAFL
jgi:hypothetical protein